MKAKKYQRKRIEEIYRETTSLVRVGENKTEEFHAGGVSQGCILNSTLFNEFKTDLEVELRKVKEGGLMVGKEKV